MKAILLLLVLLLSWVDCRPELFAPLQTLQHTGINEQEMKWRQHLHRQIHENVHRLQMQASLSSHNPSSTSTNPADEEAVRALYTVTNGDYWFNHTNWMKGDPCNDEWYGLYCINGRILQINLVFNNMTGALPAKLAQADMLQVIRLYSNVLSGTLPPEILQMKSLQILDLDANQISNSLPDVISMPNLTSLVLYQNNIQGNLPSQWNTPQLETLEISTNHLTGSLPEGLSTCKNLQTLVVSRNNLTGQFPYSYGDLIYLKQLWLFSNSFSEPQIPNSWAGMKSLQDVEMDGIYGTFPTFIGESWEQLTNLVLINGKLTGKFDTSICNLRKLLTLELFGNQLTGSLPECMCNMRSLTELELSDNQFTGSIPYCLGSISNLTFLYLSRNNLSGVLPTSMGSLAQLQILDVSSNLLTGTVPSSFAGLSEVVGFALSYNKFYELENGLEPLYNRIQDYSCELYGNPWSCPLPSDVPPSCKAQCSKCNSGNKHTSCSACVADSSCGWCNEGPNCLEGSDKGPYDIYRCNSHDWVYGSSSNCP